MLEYKADGKTADIMMSGDTITVANDVCNMVRAVYRGMAERDRDSATAFRGLIMMVLNGDDIWKFGKDADPAGEEDPDPASERARAAMADRLFKKFMEIEFNGGGDKGC